MKKVNMRSFVLASVFSAIIVLMTIIPYLGYITYGPVEITTLHIVVIMGAVFLGPKYGALLGGVWGITCVARAMIFAAANPVFEIFINPLVSLVPRILVGFVAGLVFYILKNKTKLGSIFSAAVSAVAGTFTNTLLVLSMMYIFSGMITSYSDIFELFKSIWLTLIGINGLIELVAAIIIVPAVYKSLEKTYRR